MGSRKFWKRIAGKFRAGGSVEEENQPADSGGGNGSIVIDGRELDIDDLVLSTSAHTADRAEAVLPGTQVLTPILLLEPPKIDPELQDLWGIDGDREIREFAPDPVAEYALRFKSESPFDTVLLSAQLTPELREHFGYPTFFVRTVEGRVTFMKTSEKPELAVEIIPSWSLRETGEEATARIVNGAQGVTAWIKTRPESFSFQSVDQDELAKKMTVAKDILAVRPSQVTIAVWPEAEDISFDGKALWFTLHAMGLRWGDMDQFQWADITQQTDYLFWAVVDDGKIGYALPEEIAAGRQHFHSVMFEFDIARCPAPAHILVQMIKAAEMFADKLGGKMAAFVDQKAVEGPGALAAAVAEVEQKLCQLGVKPGSPSVCQLR